MSVKNALAPAAIEPATFRFVAQHLNHCATAVPIYLIIYIYIYVHKFYVKLASNNKDVEWQLLNKRLRVPVYLQQQACIYLFIGGPASLHWNGYRKLCLLSPSSQGLEWPLTFIYID